MNLRKPHNAVQISLFYFRWHQIYLRIVNIFQNWSNVFEETSIFNNFVGLAI